jgi:4-amino-4-deoxy-L-arabinose transferase-like glycosyltransferase
MIELKTETVEILKSSNVDRSTRDFTLLSSASPRAFSLPKSLLILFLLALAIRIWWIKERVTTIEGEGVHYARMVENLAAGKGWVGMGGALQVFYPPLYPLLSTGIYFFIHNSELSSRIVSMLFGVLLIFPIFLIASELYDKRVALIAATLVALHPMFVGVSAAVYSESTYLFLLFTAVFCGMRSIRRQSKAWATASGILFGFAYLVRTEALMGAAFFIFLIIIIIAVGRKNPRTAFASASLLLIACLVVAAPYVWFLKAKTGEFRIEAKSADNFAYGTMKLAGVAWEPAFRTIDNNLVPVGLSMRSDLDVLHTTKYNLRTTLRFVKLAARDNARSLVHDLFEESSSGGFMLVALVVMGLFGSAWNRKRAAQEAAVLAFLALLFVPLLTLVDYFNTRYILPFLFVLIIWAANGVAELAGWTRKTVSSLGLDNRMYAEMTSRLIPFASAAVLLALAWGAIGHVDNFRKGDSTLKAAGLYLKGHFPAGFTVMDTDGLIAYYSGGIYRPFPYASENTALRYIAAKSINVLVLRHNNPETSNPYYQSWVSAGIPDSHASLIGSFTSEEFGRIDLYRRN